MSLNPTSLSLHNFGSNSPQSGTVTVSFTNGANASFSVAQVNGLTISVSGNNINIASQSGGNNRGNFTVSVTPSNCGSAGAQSVAVSVAK
jgi:hypothetical protein